MFGRPRTSEELQAWLATRPPPMTQEEEEAARREQIENGRLHMAPLSRMTMAAIISFLVGGSLGSLQASKMAGLQFRAEHAHKLPTTQMGWYMYHKSKNYVTSKAGVKGIFGMGFKVSFWTTSLLAIESLYDSSRQSKDFLNTVMASLTVAGGFSLWNRFSLAMTARTTKTALVVGLVYGTLQDVAGVARGRRIGYVEWFRKQFRASDQSEDLTAP